MLKRKAHEAPKQCEGGRHDWTQWYVGALPIYLERRCRACPTTETKDNH